MRKPAALPPGGTIGVINASSPCKPDRLESGCAFLNERGFKTIVGPHVLDCNGHKAGTDADRAADFMDFYADPAIDLVWCARGGYSAYRLWPLLDWTKLAALPPKMVIGYSDPTALLVPLNQLVGVVATYGPMVFELGGKIPPAARDWVLNLVQSTDALGEVPGRAVETVVPGMAEGALAGGCLALFAATLGTPYQIDARDRLLLIEDTGETPQRMERYLMQLSAAGVLDQAAGFIVGEASDCDESGAVPMYEIWLDFLLPLGKPAVLGFPFGHVTENYAMPLGVQARLDADSRGVTLLESAVARR